ncbi:MAG: DNA repair protein RecO [Coriobacteriia bacterium]|nr:DNA repair protein RecO [Coriobacteriia bacterium]
MPNVSERIIVLKKTKLAEMDLIITGFTESGHQIKTVVKGGRKPGSRRGSHLELFSVSQVLVYQGRSSLTTLSEVELVKSHSGCRVDIEHSSAAAALAELVEVITRDADFEPRLFLLLDASLDAIENTPIDGLEMVTAAAILKIVSQIGFQPSLDSCVICGRERSQEAPGQGPKSPAAEDESSRARRFRFSFAQGGLVCYDCYHNSMISDDGTGDGGSAPDAVFSPDIGNNEPGFAVTDDMDPALFDWLALLIKSRFVDLASHATEANRPTALLLLAFARNWMRAHITARNRSVDFLLSLR